MPFSYQLDQATGVIASTERWLTKRGLDEIQDELFWSYYESQDLIPQTVESMWSGHFFPWLESYDDLTISYRLASMGFYKQAMAALRSALELGLLSVYWNLRDEGHREVREWIRGEQQTPFSKPVWDRLKGHPNFQAYRGLADLRNQLNELDVLHRYVHTRGAVYSNSMGEPLRGNELRFMAEALQTWHDPMETAVEVLLTLHLIKYPLGTVEYDWSQKFGIDVPSFGGVSPGVVGRFRKVLGEERWSYLEAVAEADERTASVKAWIEDLPDITDKETENQVRQMDQLMVQQIGFDAWAEQERRLIENLDAETKSRTEQRIAALEDWARNEGL